MEEDESQNMVQSDSATALRSLPGDSGNMKLFLNVTRLKRSWAIRSAPRHSTPERRGTWEINEKWQERGVQVMGGVDRSCWHSDVIWTERGKNVRWRR